MNRKIIKRLLFVAGTVLSLFIFAVSITACSNHILDIQEGLQTQTTPQTDNSTKGKEEKTPESTPAPATPAVSYSITVTSSEHGTVSVNKTSASIGETVSITVTPESGYTLDAITVTDSNGNAITISANRTFSMPESNVTVSGTFKAVLSSISISGSLNPSLSNFILADMAASTYGLTVTAIYEDSSTQDVSSEAVVAPVFSTSPGNITIKYTENEITKTSEITGSYYTLANEALIQSVVDNGTVTINGTSYQLVKFGNFPQTKAGNGLTYSTSTIYNGWYLGNDGYFYERKRADPYPYGGNDTTYTDNTLIESGTFYYFKVEPIEWRVLTSSYDHDGNPSTVGQKLLLAEKILTADVLFFDDVSSNITFRNGENIYANNYKYSQLRAYLNGLRYYDKFNNSRDTYTGSGFLQKAFTTNAQALISTTNVDNSAESTTDAGNNITKANGTALQSNGSPYPDYTCENTDDKIFLLSEKEVTTSAYGFSAYNNFGSGNSRIRFTTDYAKANFAWDNQSDSIGGSWWLRSPAATTYTPTEWQQNRGCQGRYVNEDGSADYTQIVNNRPEAICPALCISF